MDTFPAASAFSPGRLVESMMRTLGGGEMVLRFKGEPLISDTSTDPRLGLSADTVEDVTISPALCRELENGSYEYTTSASIFEQHPELQERGTATFVFDSALGVVREHKLLRIVSVSADVVAGASYLYRLTVQE